MMSASELAHTASLLWPKEPCKHARFPKLAAPDPAKEPFNPPFLSLAPTSYNATDLQNTTVVGFLVNTPQPHQIKARDAFVRLYCNSAPRAKVWASYRSDPNKAVFTHMPNHACSQEEKPYFAKCLQDLMRHLDDYFFFGTLTRAHPEHGVLVELYSGFHSPEGAEPVRKDALGVCSQSKRGMPFQDIYIFTSCNGDAITWDENVATLLHEMVHAYLRIFVCRLQQCKRNTYNTVGISGHGKTFMRMHSLMLAEVRKWHPSLSGLDSSRDHNGNCIDFVSYNMENYVRSQHNNLAMFYLPLISDNPRNLVRLMGDLSINYSRLVESSASKPKSRKPKGRKPKSR